MGDEKGAVMSWRGKLGRAYTERNFLSGAQLDDLYRADFGLSRTALDRLLLAGVDRSISILECGANMGAQLELLQALGFSRLYAIEIQQLAITRRRGTAHFSQASILDLPFPDGAFDLVFTSRVLIHIRPADLPRALGEIYRVSRRYLWGFEYYAPSLQEIPWHGHRNMLWKGDYARMLHERFPLRKVRHVRVGYCDNANMDAAFLMEKRP